MILREITIGRSADSDIYLDESYVYASNNHGVIYFEGQQMMYRDISRNGTIVNDVMVKQRAVPINHGDIILLAGCYQLDWNQIDMFFSRG